MSAYYNENDKNAAAWLRELIKQGHIAPGEVDERSIEEIKPDDLRGFTQCHFFAGIGVWSYALRNAGWSDDSPVWTGSCPCQSFSASGKRGGFSDKRHLWPAWFRLISECRPNTIFGEQVASKDGLAWLDVVSAEMEAAGYAIGTADLCAAGFGAPHIRQRLYFVAEPDRQQLRASGSIQVVRTARTTEERKEERQRIRFDVGECSTASSVAESCCEQDEPTTTGRLHSNACGGCAADELAHTGRGEQSQCGNSVEVSNERNGEARSTNSTSGPGTTNGFWRDAEWLYCKDGKYRPTQSGLFPLAHGASARVGRLRGYGNAINAEVAKGFIEAYLETLAA